MKKRKKQIYFALMEVIGVMTIIIILLTIFLPILSKSREWGKNIKCSNNMKAIAEGLLSYAHEHSGLLPATGQRTVSSVSWTRYLINYGYLPLGKYNVKGAAYNSACDYYPTDHSTIWSCPAEDANIGYNKYLSDELFGPGVTYINGNKAWGFYWRGGTHYAMNIYFYDSGGRARIYKFNSMSRKGLLMDHKGGQREDCIGYFYYNATNIVWGSPSTGWSVNFGANLGWARHFGRAKMDSSNYSTYLYMNLGTSKVNTVFLDGHLEGWSNNFYWNNYHARGIEPFNLLYNY